MNDSPVPSAFTVRAHRVVPIALLATAALLIFDVVRDPRPLGIAAVVACLLGAFVQYRWRATVSPEGLSFSNPMGVSWDRPWSDLRSGVSVRVPGTLGSLVRAKADGGRRVIVPNGVVRDNTGQKVAPDTARALIKGWAELGTADADD